MKKIALAALFTVLGSVAAQADVFNVTLDGSCTKYYVNVQQYQASGVRYGCAGEALEGGAVARVDRQRGVLLSESYMGLIVTFYFKTPEAGAGKVYVTVSNGEESELVAATTYTIDHNTTMTAGSGPDFMNSIDFGKLKKHQ